MRTPLDVLRSVKAQVSFALGDAWEVRLAREQGMFKRPFAHVHQATGASYSPNSGRFLATVEQTVVVQAYPPRASRADYALAQAQSVEQTLAHAIRAGTGHGRAMRIPLLSYDAAPITDGDAPDQAGVWFPKGDFIRVHGLSTQPFTDPDDDKLWTVVATLQLGWRQTAEPSATGPWLEDLHVHEGPWAAFDPLPSNPAPGQSVAFNATLSFSATGPLRWHWSFDDQTTSTVGPTVEHAFTDPGVYDVTLIVTNPLGQTQTFHRLITVS